MGILREEWRDVVTHADYEVSNLGRVRRKASSHRRRAGKPSPDFLATNLTQFGYLRVSLGQGGKRRAFHVHRLVADAFLGPRPPGTEVNHIDGNRQNPRLANLEYVTPSENIRHSFRIGIRPPPQGELNPRAKLSEGDVLEILLLEGTMRQKDIADKYGVDQVLVSQIFRGLAWSYLTGRVYAGPKRRRSRTA
jgi:hypothetical protein